MGNKIYVGNLSYTLTESTLSEHFAQYGTVDSAKIIMDRDTNRSKGFGFIEMSNDDEAANAIENLNGVEVDGRQLRVNEAKPQEPRGNRGGGGGYGGNGGNRGGRY